MYEGPGIYQHYKGHYYAVLGIGLKEDTVRKPDQPEHDDAGPELYCVVYKPLEEGSLLDERCVEINGVKHPVEFWLREALSDFNGKVVIDMKVDRVVIGDDGPRAEGHGNAVPRFRKLDVGEVMRLRNNRQAEWAMWLAMGEGFKT